MKKNKKEDLDLDLDMDLRIGICDTTSLSSSSTSISISNFEAADPEHGIDNRHRHLSEETKTQKKATRYLWLLACLLGFGVLARCSLASLIYLVCFFAVIQVGFLRQSTRCLYRFLKIMFGVLLIVSSVSLLTLVIYNILDHSRPYDPDWYLLFLGLQKLDSIPATIRLILPDILLLALSIFLFYSFSWSSPAIRRPFSPRSIRESTLSSLSQLRTGGIGHSIVIILLLGGACLFNPSLLAAVYALLMLSSMFFMSYFCKPNVSMFGYWTAVFPLFYPFVVLHLSFLYILRIEYIQDLLSPSLQRLLGLRGYGDWSISLFPVYVEWICLALLVVVLSPFLQQFLDSCRRNETNKISEIETFLSPSKTSYKDQIDSSLATPVILSYFATYGWILCVLELLAVCFLVPGIINLINLIALCVFTLLSGRFATKFWSVLNVYLILELICQYIYNLPFGDKSFNAKDYGLVDFGFYYCGLFLGIQFLVYLSTSLLVCSSKFPRNIASISNNGLHFSGSEQVASISPTIISDEDNEVVEDNSSSSVLKQREVQVKSEEHQSFFARYSSLAHNIRIWFYHLVCFVVSAALRHSYKLSLLALYIIGMDRVNLFNAGYIFVFVLFILSSRIADYSWGVFVVYCQFVLLISYFWQFHWTLDWENSYTKFIGLEHYKNFWDAQIWTFIVVVLVVCQWHLNKKFRYGFYNSSAKGKSDQFSSPSNSVPIQTESDSKSHITFASYALSYFKQYSILISYLILFLTGVISKLTLIAVLYLAILIICLLLHFFLANGQRIISKIWPVFVFLSISVLLLRYLYQFDLISTYVQNHFHPNKFITLEEIGLEVYPVSRLFLGLIGNFVVFLILAFQWKVFVFFKGIKDEVYEVKGYAKTAVGVYKTIFKFFERLFFLHFGKVSVFVIIFMSIQSPTAIGFLIFGFIVLSTFFERGIHVFSGIIMIISCIAAISIILMPFSAFDGLVGDYFEFLEWIGVFRRYSTYPLFSSYVLIMTLLVIQVIAKRWQKWYASTYSVDGPILLFEISPKTEFFISGDSLPLLEMIKFVASNFYTLYGSYIIFLTFCLVVFFRVDALGLIYLLVLVCQPYLSKRSMKIGTFCFILFVSLISIVQYVWVIGLPSLIHYDWPWTNMDLSLQTWLILYLPFRHILLLDFLVIFLVNDFLHQRPRMMSERKAEKMPESGKKIISIDEISLIQSKHDFTQQPRGFADNFKYYIFRYSHLFSLVIVFVAGTSTFNLLSFGYFFFSLYYLCVANTIYAKTRFGGWFFARYFNFLVIGLQIVYQPYKIIYGAGFLAQLIGLRPLSLLTQYSGGDTLFNIIILILLAFQWNLFQNEREMCFISEFVRKEKHQQARFGKSSRIAEMQRQIMKIDERAADRIERKKRMLVLRMARQNELDEGIDRKEEVIKGSASELGSDEGQQDDHEPFPILLEDILAASQGSTSSSISLSAPVEENSKFRSFVLNCKNFLLKWEDILIDWLHSNEDLRQKAEIELSKENLSVESIESDLESVEEHSKSRFFRLLHGIQLLLQDSTVTLCLICFVLNHFFSGSVISLVLTIIGFGYIIFVSVPYPKKHFWKGLSIFIFIVLSIKFIFQLPGFCICSGQTCQYWYIAKERCFPPECPFPRCALPGRCDFRPRSHLGITIPHLVGIYTIDGPFITGVLWDLLSLLSIVYHMAVMTSRGNWTKDMYDLEKQNRQYLLEYKMSKVTHSQSTIPTDNVPLLMRWIPSKVYRFYSSIWDDFVKEGVEKYTQMFIVEVFCFIFLVVFPHDFTGVGGDFSQYLSRSLIPRQYVSLLLLQFMLILTDRVIYLFKSVKAKILMQYSTIVYYHVLLFFYLPLRNDKPFIQSPALMVFYLLKCAYWIFSGLQIRYGYPTFSSSRYLMSSYSKFVSISFSTYRAIPFVYELRTFMDWTINNTTMDLFQYLKFEDLYAEVFSTKCAIEDRRRENRKIGDKRKVSEKILFGALLVALLVIVLWFPLVLLSSGSPGTATAPIQSVDIKLGVVGWNDFLKVDTDSAIYPYRGANFSELRRSFKFIEKDDEYSLERADLIGYASSIWQISPPSLENLKNSLIGSREVWFYFIYTINRNSAVNDVVKDKELVYLNETKKHDLWEVLNGNRSEIVIPSLYYRFVQLPGATGDIVPMNRTVKVDVSLSLKEKEIQFPNNTIEVVRWWQAEQVYMGDQDKLFNKTRAMQLVILSTKVPSGLALSIASYGIIGLYATVVLAIGRFLRMSVAQVSHNIIYENMPECEEIIELCNDIILAREDEDLVLEEILWLELVEIYRSNVKLLEKTRIKEKTD